LTVARACALLQLSRSQYYAAGQVPAAAPLAAAEQQLRERLEALCLEFPRYGYRRLTAQLRREGWRVNHKRVLRLQQELHLTCRVRRRTVRTTQSQHGFRRYPNLLRHHPVEGLNQAWAADFTYLRLRDQFAYLAVLLDVHSRKVIGWALGTEATTALCVRALRQALTRRRPPAGFLHHSDQGVQYASTEYVALLEAHGAVLSMSRTGNPYDNAQVESFFKTLKHEEVYLNEYATVADAQRRLPHFLEAVYNQKRLHSALGYLPPSEFEAQLATPK
jgi:transposase InsO family protein